MWQTIIVWVATTVLSALLMPRQKQQNAQPGQIADKDVPLAEAGKSIPVLFGTRVISGPNVVWYGDIRIVPIKQKGGKK